MMKPGSPEDKAMEKRMGVKPGSPEDKRMEQMAAKKKTKHPPHHPNMGPPNLMGTYRPVKK